MLGAALQCQARYLVTLDKRHLLTPRARAAGLNLVVCSPGEFLRSVRDEAAGREI